MIATPFDAVSGDGAGIMIKDLVTGEIPVGAEMQVRLKNGGYDIYNYIETAYDEELDEERPGWADGDEYLVKTKLAPGAAFWLKVPSVCDVSLAGQILTDASKETDFNKGIYSMIGNPYPVDVNPNNLEWTGLSYGDEMQVRLDKGGYDIYNYIETAYDEELDEERPGWADGDEYLVKTKILRSARGAWIKPAKAISINWQNPIQ